MIRQPEIEELNKLLEEVQQLRKEMWELNQICRDYTSLGTVEECRENKDFLKFLYNWIPPNEMEQYLSMYHIKDKTPVNRYADQCGLMSATYIGGNEDAE